MVQVYSPRRPCRFRQNRGKSHISVRRKHLRGHEDIEVPDWRMEEKERPSGTSNAEG